MEELASSKLPKNAFLLSVVKFGLEAELRRAMTHAVGVTTVMAAAVAFVGVWRPRWCRRGFAIPTRRMSRWE